MGTSSGHEPLVSRVMTTCNHIGRTGSAFGMFAAVGAWVLTCAAVASAHAAGSVAGNCRVGSYHLQDGSDVDIGLGNDAHLRWRRKDGTSGELTATPDGTWTSTFGWTSRDDGKRVAFSECSKGEVTFAGTKGQRIALTTTETHFQSEGVNLAGRLVMPTGRGKVPVVILIHGSEDSSARDFFALQRMFPSEGIGTFVYDKRGTGASEGSYTQSYPLLAKDAVAAMETARRLAGARAGKVGYQGGSQAGWVIPLAATLAPVDFIVVGYGLAVSPLDEDRSAVVLDMTRHGYGPDVIAKALEVADATQAVIVSNFKEGYDRVDAIRAKYGSEPWFKYIHGNITFAVLGMPHGELREKGPKLLPDVDPYYDPMPVLRKLNTPQLWILGEDDIDAPSAETARRLAGLAADGRPIVTAMFPHAEHGIFEFETSADGTRVSTRNSAGYFYMMRDYIRTGLLHGRYGSSVISGRRQ
jgi:uncharacterized protein